MPSVVAYSQAARQSASISAQASSVELSEAVWQSCGLPEPVSLS